RRGRRYQGCDEPLPEDRIRQAVGRDRLDRCQFRRAVFEEALDAAGLPEFWRAAEIEWLPTAQNYSGKKRIFPGVRPRSHVERYFLLCIPSQASPRMPGDFR